MTSDQLTDLINLVCTYLDQDDLWEAQSFRIVYGQSQSTQRSEEVWSMAVETIGRMVDLRTTKVELLSRPDSGLTCSKLA